MKNSTFTLEHALYLLALVIAAFFRFLNLAVLPLSEFEAGWALQALHIVRGLRPALDANPAYLHLTAPLFFVFGATTFLARFWPALAGSALAVLPFFFRDRLGRLPALILAFGLAIDPGLVGLSRLAGSSMLAIAFVLFAWAMWKAGRRALTGVFAALALLSGPSVWFGLLGLLLAWAIARGVTPNPAEDAEEPEPETRGRKKPQAEPEPETARFGWERLRLPLLWGLGTLLVVGSLLLISPKGLAAFVDSLVAFAKGWWTVSDTLMRDVLLAIPAYEAFPFIFGIAAGVRGVLKRDPLSISLSAWGLVALVLAVVYPGKQVADLAWALIPFWALAAVELSRHFDFEGRNLWEIAGVFVLTVALVVFAWLNLAALTNMDLTSNDARTRMYLMLFVFLFLGMSLVLIAVGWSARIARLGAVWAGVLLLGAYTIAMMTAAGGLRQPLTQDLWQPEPGIASADLLLQTANQVSDLNKGAVDALPIVVDGIDSPALLWVLRSWNVQVVSDLSATSSPPIVITLKDAKVDLAQGYRGEGFSWHTASNWRSNAASDWLRWFVYHKLPVQRDTIVFWVRGDLAIDSQGQQPATTP